MPLYQPESLYIRKSHQQSEAWRIYGLEVANFQTVTSFQNTGIVRNSAKINHEKGCLNSVGQQFNKC